ncbi:MAG: hypothetical protein QOE93_2480, partial [Actinomycetota bacterium]|nr:hypothetical protein [Actinomycetota bacterium]
QEVIVPMMQAAGIPPSDIPPVFYPLHRLLTA